METGSVKTWGKALVKTAVFLTVLSMLFVKAQEILKLNMGHRGTDNVKGFYEEKENSIEVLFIGPSTMFCTADPLVLYEEYGIASYDFCSSSQAWDLSCLFMEEAFRYQKPKVVVLETTLLTKELDPDKAENLNYGITDMPFSLRKAKSLYEMFRGDKGSFLSYLIPMAQYKDRWQELTREDFTDTSVNYSKGAYTPAKIADSPLDFSSYYEEQEAVVPDHNIDILDRMQELCRENGAELLLIKAPNVGWNIGETKAVARLAQEEGIPFIDFFALMDELGIDAASDFRDNTHLNRFGSAKASDYLGSYLCTHYTLTDYRTLDSENSWDIALQHRNHDRKNERLGTIEGLPDYMSCLPYANHTVAFSVTGDVSGMEEFLRGLAQAFGLDGEQLLSGGSFAVRDGECISGLVDTTGGAWQWEEGFDTIELTGYSITYNREVYQLVDNGLTIFVYDNAWGKFVDVAGFDAGDPAHCVRPKME